MAILGQTPSDVSGALFQAKNFSDVPDKALARQNLGVPSLDQVQYNGLPIGVIVPYWGNTAPAGFLPCSGQTISASVFPELVAFLGGTTSAVVPDLRGEFLRGWDNGRGVDAGRTVKSWQNYAVQAHYHPPVAPTGMGYGYYSGGTITSDSGRDGFTDFINSSPTSLHPETRPRNVAVLYCIKAYDAVVDSGATARITGLISDYSELVATSVKQSDQITGLISDYSELVATSVKRSEFSGVNQSLSENGYQKLPGGLIIQWGTFTTISSGRVLVVFPISFTEALYSCSLIEDAEASDGMEMALVDFRRTTLGQIEVHSNYHGKAKYIAIGK